MEKIGFVAAVTAAVNDGEFWNGSRDHWQTELVHMHECSPLNVRTAAALSSGNNRAEVNDYYVMWLNEKLPNRSRANA